MTAYVRTVCGRMAADIREYGIAIIAVVIYMIFVNVVFHAFCPLVIVSGFPCPGCGVTRAAVCLLTGRWRQAWQLNPVIFPIALTAVYFGWNRYLLGRKAMALRGMIVAVFALLLCVYCVRMYLWFPDRAPYVYAEDNVLARGVPFYRDILHRLGL